eukprot:CAMPEP_0194201128 /NCGR_PEP_ID=MMETSP0156-20130528/1483_1 /TAXON_ID=33649 /ORGANISM="Thalassionema nitzschioides, Strain L26-B" /LENGTH=91 /DNA_ID=CAMNT_0038926243 /DNA_START=38 /DNA_END=313 /DNA_ORIENTATION=-
MIRPALLRPVLSRAQPQRRMAGGFPPSMRAKKNKFIEEWNGLRETTELKFDVDQGMLPAIITMIVLIPAGVYVWTKAEFASKGDRRYAKTC